MPDRKIVPARAVVDFSVRHLSVARHNADVTPYQVSQSSLDDLALADRRGPVLADGRALRAVGDAIAIRADGDAGIWTFGGHAAFRIFSDDATTRAFGSGGAIRALIHLATPRSCRERSAIRRRGFGWRRTRRLREGRQRKRQRQADGGCEHSDNVFHIFFSFSTWLIRLAATVNYDERRFCSIISTACSMPYSARMFALRYSAHLFKLCFVGVA